MVCTIAVTVQGNICQQVEQSTGRSTIAPDIPPERGFPVASDLEDTDMLIPFAAPCVCHASRADHCLAVL